MISPEQSVIGFFILFAGFYFGVKYETETDIPTGAQYHLVVKNTEIENGM